MPRPSSAKSNARARLARSEDLPALAAVIEAAFAPYTAIIGRPPAPLTCDPAPYLAQGTAFVAEHDGAVVGVALWRRADAGTDHAAMLDVLAVHPGAHRAGVGTLLIAAVEQAAADGGAPRLALYTNVAMEAAKAFYRRHGFTESAAYAAEGFSRQDFVKALPPRLVRKQPVAGLHGRRSVHGHRLGRDYERFAVDLSIPFARHNLPKPTQPMRVEFGFGGGEHLAHAAAQRPDICHLGVEPFETGMARLAKRALAEQLDNLALYSGDARDVVAWLGDRTVERVDILYPDPWPKQKHWKRRIVSMPMLDQLARVLVPRGEIRFASDIPSYVAWTLAHAERHPQFRLTRHSDAPWDDWPSTRYEAKALREGRHPAYLTFESLAS